MSWLTNSASEYGRLVPDGIDGVGDASGLVHDLQGCSDGGR